jgi:hypothetical protein
MICAARIAVQPNCPVCGRFTKTMHRLPGYYFCEELTPFPHNITFKP